MFMLAVPLKYLEHHSLDCSHDTLITQAALGQRLTDLGVRRYQMRGDRKEPGLEVPYVALQRRQQFAED